MINLILAAMVDVALTAILYMIWENRSPEWGGENKEPLYWQVAVGILFGCAAIFATETGVDIGGAAMNIRDAAPLCAGLIFGGPAGIIAGLIGGIERALAVHWGAGGYTVIACSVSTVLAGFYSALLRKFIFDRRIPSVLYGLFSGIVMETVHMLMVFLTHMNDIQHAFTVVEKCTLPMMAINSLAVMFAIVAVKFLSDNGHSMTRKHELRQISQSFQRALLACIVVAFLISSVFIRTTQTSLAKKNASDLLRTNITDIRQDVSDASDQNILSLTHDVVNDISSSGQISNSGLSSLMAKYDVSEIDYINSKGIIEFSTSSAFVGYDMSSGSQSAEFLPLLGSKKEYVQAYGPISYNKSIYRKYAGVKYGSGFIQVAYNAERFQKDIAGNITDSASNRHVGKSGYVIVSDRNSRIVAGKYKGRSLSDIGLHLKGLRQDSYLSGSINGQSVRYMFVKNEGYTILTVIPKSEVTTSRDLSVYMNIFMETLIFAALFILIYYLIRKLIVENIHKVNRSLSRITDGDLDTTVDVRTSAEFASLSDDINTTVVALKRYIAEAAARIDRELEFAKAIQTSTLPSVTDNVSKSGEFDIYADMKAAKEVGGDFYDFYYIDDSRFAVTVADVSGKGIPAAMFMMRAKATLKSLAEEGLGTADILAGANDQLCEGNDSGMFVTAWLGIIDLNTGIMKAASAGHNPPVLIRADGKTDFCRFRPGFVLAGMEGSHYRENEIRLESGDRLFLYTDGVTEATNSSNELYGDDRLLAVSGENGALPPKALCECISRSVDAFAGDAPQFDDITMLCFEYRGLRSYEEITVTAETANIAVVTDFAEKHLRDAGFPAKVISNIDIVIDEIISNIANYAYGDDTGTATLRLHIDESPLSATVTFIDSGIRYDPLSRTDPDITLSDEEREIGGLGIFMVKKLMDEVSYEYRNGQNMFTVRKTTD